MRYQKVMLEITEQEIMREWDFDKYSKPLVTVICMAFNHEKYISSAIEGFLLQKTTFPFEIIIHDDCSTDNTANIIKQYENKYPHLLNCTYEPENLYSKKDRPLRRFAEKCRTRAKYEAICEGDDYWIDTNKLQRQIDYMEANDGCILTFTNGQVYDVRGGQFSSLFKEGYFDIKEYEFAGKGQAITLSNFYRLKFPPTASHVYRNGVLAGIDEFIPECIAGDIRCRLYALTKGYAYYFPEETCVYRINVLGSATTIWRKYNKAEQKKAAESYIDVFDAVDKLTDYQYTNSIWELKSEYVIARLKNSNTLIDLKDDENKKAFIQQSILEKIKIIIKILMPDYIYSVLWKRKP